MRWLGVAALALLGGCAVGPNYQRPAPPRAAAGPLIEAAASNRPLPANWWRLYADPTLDALVDEALRHNTDIRVAAANLKRARYVLAEARAGLLPTTDASASFTHRRTGSESIGTAGTVTTGGIGAGGTGGTGTGGTGGTGTGGTGTGGTGTGGTGTGGTGTGGTGTGGTGTGGTGTGGTTGGGTTTGSTTTSIPSGFVTDFFSIGMDVAYELDLFGGVRRGIEAARGEFAATEAALDAARVAVAAETARSYGEACGYAAQAATARETVQLQARTLDLTQRLNEGGRGTLRDVSQALTLYEQAQADLPTFEGEQRAALDALAVLTGRAPSALDPALARCAAVPRLADPLPSGDGAALLARRPDVRRAERLLAADTARIGVATADLYPSISLLGGISLGATRIGDLGKAKSLNYSIGPLISWSFPIQSAARARLRQAEATAEASLANFDGTVLTALRETEQALARLDAETRRNEALVRADAAAAEAAKLSRYRFDYGADSFFALLDAERTRAQARAALAASNTTLIDNQVDLFRALGGGWEQAPAVEGRSDSPAPAPVRPE